MSTSAVQNLEVQLSESRNNFSGSCNDVSELEVQIRDLTLQLSTLQAQQETLERSVSVNTSLVVFISIDAASYGAPLA